MRLCVETKIHAHVLNVGVWGNLCERGWSLWKNSKASLGKN